MNNLKITVNLDGTGVYYDHYEPLHLDALLASFLAPMQLKTRGQQSLSRNDKPDFVKLPLQKTKINGHDVWNASAFFLDAECPETIRYWRKKFRASKVDGMTKGSPNLMRGLYREWNMPVPLTLAHKIIAYAKGDKLLVEQLLRAKCKSIGKKRYGRVTDITCQIIGQNYSLIKEGAAMRYLPSEHGSKFVRPMPPYWNIHGRIQCYDVGDLVTEHI